MTQKKAEMPPKADSPLSAEQAAEKWLEEQFQKHKDTLIAKETEDGYQLIRNIARMGFMGGYARAKAEGKEREIFLNEHNENVRLHTELERERERAKALMSALELAKTNLFFELEYQQNHGSDGWENLAKSADECMQKCFKRICEAIAAYKSSETSPAMEGSRNPLEQVGRWALKHSGAIENSLCYCLEEFGDQKAKAAYEEIIWEKHILSR